MINLLSINDQKPVVRKIELFNDYRLFRVVLILFDSSCDKEMNCFELSFSSQQMPELF